MKIVFLFKIRISNQDEKSQVLEYSMKGVLYNAAIMVVGSEKNDDWEEVLKCRYNQVALGCCLLHSSSSSPNSARGSKRFFYL